MADLEQLLTRIGWKQRQLATHIEVNEDTVSRWKQGKRKTPKVVLLYLELLAERMNV